MNKRLLVAILARDEDPTFFSTDPDPAQLEKNRIRPEIEMKKTYVYMLGR